MTNLIIIYIKIGRPEIKILRAETYLDIMHRLPLRIAGNALLWIPCKHSVYGVGAVSVGSAIDVAAGVNIIGHASLGLAPHLL